MGAGPRLSRREILDGIPLLSSESLLLPLGAQPSPAPNGVIRGAVLDAATGQPVAAKMRVAAAGSGDPYMPAACIKTMPAKSRTGVRYFYVRGAYEAALPAGRYDVEVVRGICHHPEFAQVEVEAGRTIVRDFRLRELWDLHASGWYSGNTHTHYNVDIEESVDERLRMVPPAEAVDVSVISYLIRKDLPYPSNRIPIGRLPQFSCDGVVLDMGEECRNNSAQNSIPFGYGHCLFLNIPRLVQPASTGMLSADPKAPDFPTVSMLCEEARRIGGTTVWCHNGHGLEAPVAVALGCVDALNIADGFPVEYEGYYRFLNCGFRLPISSGTDWWEYDHNRVFVRVEGAFRYESWLAGLRAGRTMVSNGPLLELAVDGRGPGAEVKSAARPVRVTARALSRVPFERLELVQDGEVVASKAAEGRREARIDREIVARGGGWIAARVAGSTATRLGYPVFAHTNPVYFDGPNPPRRAEAASALAAELDKATVLIRKTYQFRNDADRAVALGRFEDARRRYEALKK